MDTCPRFNRAVVVVTTIAILLMGWNRCETRRNWDRVASEVKEVRGETQTHREKVEAKLDEIVEALEAK